MENISNWMGEIFDSPYIPILFMAFLLIAAYTDIKYRKIYNWLNVTFFILWFITIPIHGFSWMNIIGAILGFVLMLIPAMVKNQKMGGDIKAAGVIGLYMGVPGIFPFFLMTATTFIVYVLVMRLFGKQLQLLPMGPFFLGAFLFMSSLNFTILQ
ncbi:A24 family peptidase [Psychrobacillus sp. FSL H8-0510]|uniref:A24 family peptidase n=1 Tax=Psychrobacillus sp. FSL H8-0510 TaxID=2921394 RepID=UPI0030F7434D